MSADERGFTLIEALVALVIVAVTVVGALEAFGAGLRAQSTANAHLAAVVLAETKMSEIATLPFDSLPGTEAIQEGSFAPPFERYRWRAAVRLVPRSPGLRRAAVLVEWEGGEFSLETVLFRARQPWDAWDAGAEDEE